MQNLCVFFLVFHNHKTGWEKLKSIIMKNFKPEKQMTDLLLQIRGSVLKGNLYSLIKFFLRKFWCSYKINRNSCTDHLKTHYDFIKEFLHYYFFSLFFLLEYFKFYYGKIVGFFSKKVFIFFSFDYKISFLKLLCWASASQHTTNFFFKYLLFLNVTPYDLFSLQQFSGLCCSSVITSSRSCSFFWNILKFFLVSEILCSQLKNCWGLWPHCEDPSLGSTHIQLHMP